MISAERSADGIRIRRRCPSCGAAVEHSETDTAVACAYCHVELAILGDRGTPRYAVPVRPDVGAARIEAARFLRGRETRVKRMGSPRVTYVPFARLRAVVYSLRRESEQALPEMEHSSNGAAFARAGLQLGLGFAAGALRTLRNEATRPVRVSRSAFGFEPDEGVFRFRVGAWEQTLCGAPSLGWGDHSLGVRTQALAVTPLDELVAASSAPDELPARVRSEISLEAAQAQLEKRLAQAHELDAGARDENVWMAPQRELQWIYWPYVTMEFEGPAARGRVILDGVTLHARLAQELPSDETTFDSTTAFDARAGEPSGWTFEQPGAGFVALLCPNCSMPLRFRSIARLFPCSNCRRLWRTEGGRLAETRGIVLQPPDAPRLFAGRTEIALPFYRVCDGSAESPATCFIPAGECRHPRAVWNLASALSRRGDVWEESQPERKLDVAVALDASEASALLPFARACASERCDLRPSKDARAELVWLRLYRESGAWIEPRSGLSVPEAALVPWSEP